MKYPKVEVALVGQDAAMTGDYDNLLRVTMDWTDDEGENND